MNIKAEPKAVSGPGTEPRLVLKAVIVQRSDRFANSVKPRALVEHLQSRGFEVEVVESAALGRRGTTGLGRSLPTLTVASMRLYALELLQAAARVLLRTKNARWSRHINGVTLHLVMRQRGCLLARQITGTGCDVLICESSLDQAVVLSRTATKQILDLPSPFGDELLFANVISTASHKTIRALEEQCLSASDRVSFHWHTYVNYVREKYEAQPHWLDCSYGVTPKVARAMFSKRPRIVFLGNLDAPWVNFALLERLSAKYGAIDVWGGPTPPKSAAIRYRGYAASLDILADYQIGLVTITDDPLRRYSFSSKQLEYFSYGLPVLVPAWRSDPLLAPGSVPYTEDTFLAQVEHLSDRKSWQQASSKALELAEALSWESALGPLTEFLCS